MVVTISLAGFVADQMQYNLKSAQYLLYIYIRERDLKKKKKKKKKEDKILRKRAISSITKLFFYI